MPNFADKGRDKAIDLQNFGLRTDLYKKIPKVGTTCWLTQHPNVFLAFKIVWFTDEVISQLFLDAK